MAYIWLIYCLYMAYVAYIWLIYGLCSGCWWNMDLLGKSHDSSFLCWLHPSGHQPIPPNHLPYHFPTMDYQQETSLDSQPKIPPRNCQFCILWGSNCCWAVETRTHSCYESTIREPGWHGSEAAPCAAWALHKPCSAAVGNKAKLPGKKWEMMRFLHLQPVVGIWELVGWC